MKRFDLSWKTILVIDGISNGVILLVIMYLAAKYNMWLLLSFLFINFDLSKFVKEKALKEK